MKRLIKILLLLASLALAFIAGIAYARLPASALHVRRPGSAATVRSGVTAPSDVEQDFAPFWEAWRLIQRDSLSPGSNSTLAQGALRGLVQSLNDPYSAFFDQAETAANHNDLDGALQGVGMALEKRAGKLLVVAPLAGSPARAAGINAGDLITGIDGRTTADMTVPDALALLRGPAGSAVTLTIERDQAASPLTLQVARSQAEVPYVSTQMLEQRIAYVKISAFAGRAPLDVAAFLRSLEGQGVRGVVLDLRDNPGGYVEAAIETAGQFITEGRIVTQMGRQGATTWSYADSGKLLIVEDRSGKKSAPLRNPPLAAGLPLVVLVNRGTASAAEILAAALQDNGRAVIIGERTFGKGTVFADYTLSDGSSIRLTNGEWLSPKGQQIQGRGLTPDIAAPSAAQPDAVLARGVEYLLSGH